MSTSNVSPRLAEGILKYLEVEEQILRKIHVLIQNLAEGAGSVPRLAEHQAGLSAIAYDLSQMQIHRQNLKTALAKAWDCEPQAVRLSRVSLASHAETARLQTQRERVQQLVISLQSLLSAAEQTLRGWSGIVGFVLCELLGTHPASGRYASNGQRVTSTHIAGIDVRT